MDRIYQTWDWPAGTHALGSLGRMIVACSAQTRPLVFETFLEDGEEDGEREEKMSEHNLKHPKTAFWFTHMFVNVEFTLVHHIFVYRGAVCFVVCFAWMSDSRTPVVVSTMLGSLHSPEVFFISSKVTVPIHSKRKAFGIPTIINKLFKRLFH